jgi:hypothetical protein
MLIKMGAGLQLKMEGGTIGYPVLLVLLTMFLYRKMMLPPMFLALTLLLLHRDKIRDM